MKLRFTPKALAELDEVLTGIRAQSPCGADHVQARIRDVTRLLVEQPMSGRRTSNPRLRRFAATPYPYLIFYEATETEVVVIAIRHGARDSATMPGATEDEAAP